MAGDTLAGKQIGNYEVLQELGRGGMGIVYKAYEHSLQRPVALKVLAPHLAQDPAFIKRFTREARAAAQLNHPNIVTVHAVGQEDGTHFIVMEFVEGISLGDYIRQKERLGAGEALSILHQTAVALHEAHRRGMIHRDIKPENIMLDNAGRVKVMDFGLAKLLRAATELTSDGQKVGTPLYMSAEQIQGKDVDNRSDLYALGVVFFEMLAGRRPLDADNPMALMYQITHEPFPDIRKCVSGVPEAAAGILDKLTARNPNDRYPTAQALCQALMALRQAPTGKSPLPKSEPPAATQEDASKAASEESGILWRTKSSFVYFIPGMIWAAGWLAIYIYAYQHGKPIFDKIMAFDDPVVQFLNDKNLQWTHVQYAFLVLTLFPVWGVLGRCLSWLTSS